MLLNHLKMFGTTEASTARLTLTAMFAWRIKCFVSKIEAFVCLFVVSIYCQSGGITKTCLSDFCKKKKKKKMHFKAQKEVCLKDNWFLLCLQEKEPRMTTSELLV